MGFRTGDQWCQAWCGLCLCVPAGLVQRCRQGAGQSMRRCYCGESEGEADGQSVGMAAGGGEQRAAEARWEVSRGLGGETTERAATSE